MEKLFIFKTLKNNSGQSLIEYVLMIAVISLLGYAVFNNKSFKDFFGGTKGMFYSMKKGMSYSYRYGVELEGSIDADSKATFNYTSADHDTYAIPGGNESRFFTGKDAYGKK